MVSDRSYPRRPKESLRPHKGANGETDAAGGGQLEVLLRFAIRNVRPGLVVEFKPEASPIVAFAKGEEDRWT